MAIDKINNMTSLQLILNRLSKKDTLRKGVLNPVSSITTDQMEIMGSYFPDAHTDAKKMYELSRANYELLGYDGIMPVFSVVVDAYGLGCKVDWGKIDMMPRVVGKKWKSYEDIRINKNFLDNHAVRAVLECISMLKASYPDLAITGKVFGPWTLSYELFGVEDFLIKTIDNSQEAEDILNKLSPVPLEFARAQIEAGADMITIADHATRDLCSPDSYRDFLIPIHKKLAKEIKVPTILHICGDTSDRIKYIAQTGVAAFHFESKVDACTAVDLAEGRIALAGNINNPEVLLFGSLDEVAERTRYAIDCGVDIIGPECAVPLNAPYKNLKEIALTVKNY
ncbi:MAG TPA: MtaA/CmuA family methyltransferase [Actinobacteria bacterium]|nr:MtaA/CmuA family methyltransferase [Actinomycetota bacterium]